MGKLVEYRFDIEQIHRINSGEKLLSIRNIKFSTFQLSLRLILNLCGMKFEHADRCIEK